MHCVFRYYPVSLTSTWHFHLSPYRLRNRNPPHFTSLIFVLPTGSVIHRKKEKVNSVLFIHLKIAPSLCVCVCFGYTIRPSVRSYRIALRAYMQGPADQITVPYCTHLASVRHQVVAVIICRQEKKIGRVFFCFPAAFYQSPVYTQTNKHTNKQTAFARDLYR